MEFNGVQQTESQKIIITERCYNFKDLLGYFEGLSSNSKIATSSIVVKCKPKTIKIKPTVINKQKKVSFDLSKNLTFLYESEESVERRLKNDLIKKEDKPIEIVIKNESKIIEQKPMVIKKLKKVSFNLAKNTIFSYESEESIERRLKNDVIKKEDEMKTDDIMVSTQNEILSGPETKTYDYKEIRLFWENGCK